MKSLYDPSFRYVPSVKTDIRKTFARVRKEQKEQEERKAAEHKVLLLPCTTRDGTR